MSRLVSRAESWEKVYSAFANINFAAFDYNTIKQSILDYIKLYFPETFNDFIESSEFIAIVEAFAYIAELLAYRIDVTTHENFISTAQRRDSILKLAKLISYKASRPIPARGLVKITSVSTSETLIDSNGINLANKTVRWNDSTNSSWKDQFILILNRVLNQDFGSVVATDRFQIQDTLFELYPMVTSIGAMPYTASVYGQSVGMELVPVAKSTGDAYTGTVSGIVERRPQQNAQFTMMYGSDGLGDASETTGFFCFTKQGTLQRYTTSFDGITPNQTYVVPGFNINDTDVWVNNVDPDTGDIVVKQNNLPYRRETLEGKYGEWVAVDIAHAQNVIFNTNPKRNKYEIETIGENQVRLIFGDGEFADIPQGQFDVWVRTSLNEDIVIPQSSIVDVPLTFSYTDSYNQAQTFSFTITLIGSLQNASAAETTEHIRENAPAVYYTQDRMVNGEDYNVYMRQNPTILKLRSINRTFAGDSKYITWHDSSNTYENVKMFSNDGIMYLQDSDTTESTPVVGTDVLISTYIEPLLSSTDIFMQLTSAGVSHAKIRRVFNYDEKTRLESSLTPPPTLRSADLYYNTFTNEWWALKTNTPSVAADLTLGGYQIINLNGYASSDEELVVYPPATGVDVGGQQDPNALPGILYPTGTRLHEATLVLFGNTPVTITFTSNPAIPATFGELIADINVNPDLMINGVTADLFNGNIRLSMVRNTADPTSSRIYVETTVENTGLFTDITIAATNVVGFEEPVYGYAYPNNFIEYPLITVRQVNQQDTKYYVTRDSRRIILESPTTAFWNTNDANRVMDYDTLRSSFDKITILQANANSSRDFILQRNWDYNILGQEVIDSGVDTGMPDIHRVSIISTDENQDNVPDYLNVEDAEDYMGIANIIKPKVHLTINQGDSYVIKLPVQYIVGFNDIQIMDESTGQYLIGPTFNVSNGSLPEEFGDQYPAQLLWQDAVVSVSITIPATVLPIKATVATLPASNTTIGAVDDRYFNTTDGFVYTVATVIPQLTTNDYIHAFDAGVPVTAGELQTPPEFVVTELPIPDTMIGSIGQRFLSTIDDKIYTVTDVQAIPDTYHIGTFSAGVPFDNGTLGVVGDRYLNTNDNRIYTVTEVTSAGSSTYITEFDSGVYPDPHWAVLDQSSYTTEVWEFNGVTDAWSPTLLPASGLSWFETDAEENLLGYGEVSQYITLTGVTLPYYDLLVKVNEYVYFQRISLNDQWVPVENNSENMLNFVDDYLMHNYKAWKPTGSGTDVITAADADIQQTYVFNRQWKRHLGRDKLNFAWFHFSPRYQLVDPSPTNIIDIFVITRGYFISFKRWLEDPLALKPDEVTPLSLRNDYGTLLDNKMVSDTVVLHPGKIKLIFGSKAEASLQGRFAVIRSTNSILTDNQIKNTIVATTRNFFDIAAFEFGETFYFTELASAIHMDLATEISSVVFVPSLQTSQFGNMLEVYAREDEILYPDISVNDIDVVTGFTATNLRMNG